MRVERTECEEGAFDSGLAFPNTIDEPTVDAFIDEGGTLQLTKATT